MSWAKTVSDWNKSKVIFDANNIYAIPFKNTKEYAAVKELYEHKKSNVKATEKIDEKREILKPLATKVEKFIKDIADKEPVKETKKKEKKVSVKKETVKKQAKVLKEEPVKKIEKDEVKIKLFPNEINAERYQLFHVGGDKVSGLFANMLTNAEDKKEYLKKVFDILYPGNKGITSDGYKLLTADMGDMYSGLDIHKRKDGKIDVKVDDKIKMRQIDADVFDRISRAILGDKIPK
jgi:hypothetical protein